MLLEAVKARLELVAAEDFGVDWLVCLEELAPILDVDRCMDRGTSDADDA